MAESTGQRLLPSVLLSRLPRPRLRALRSMSGLAVAVLLLQFLAGPVSALFIGHVDGILVDKSARTLWLMNDGRPVFITGVSLGQDPVGQKQREGDQRTPEGVYRLVWGNSDSSHHRSLLISYPSRKQALRAVAEGADPGGEIMIHGQRHWWRWLTRSPITDGCIGVSNLAMDIIWSAVELGTPIKIQP